MTPAPESWRELRLVGGMRLLLAGAGLLIIWVDPSEPDRFAGETYAVLLAYALYSLTLYGLTWLRTPTSFRVQELSAWLDLIWFTGLIALSSGTNSLFFFGFLFAILVTSFRKGTRAGLLMTAMSVGVFSVVGYLTRPPGTEFELNRFLFRPVYLAILGYLMSHWGGYQIDLNRRLRLLKDVVAVSNPRFGVDRMVSRVMDELLAFYDADVAIALVTGSEAGTWSRLVDRRRNPTANSEVPAQMTARLLILPADRTVIWTDDGGGHRDALATGDDSTLQWAAALLECRSLLSAPLPLRWGPGSRLYLGAAPPGRFKQDDAEFVGQVLGQVAPLLENIRLVDRLASDAAEVERQKIALDIHDSVIQPFIGLQLGLAALRQRLEAEHSPAVADADRLLGVALGEVTSIREYMKGLRRPATGPMALESALSRFAAKVQAATGMAIEIEVAPGLELSDRLAAEVFQIVSEGISNIRRHTQSDRATIQLGSRDEHVELVMRDYAADASPFSPHSIQSRAGALGGRTRVEAGPGGSTVSVVIPL